MSDYRDFVFSNGAHIPRSATITQDHINIHLGNGFTLAEYHEGLANSGVLNHLIVTGYYPVHIRQLIVETTQAPVVMDYFEDTTVSANGTLNPVANNNRTSTKTATAAVYEGPTITTDGTAMGSTLIPTTAKDSGGVGFLKGGEWILKPNSNYLFRVTNNSGSSIDFGLTLFFYEDRQG